MDVVCTSTLCPVKSSTTRTLRGNAAQKYALQFSFFLKKLNYKKSGGIFVKLVDCGGYLVNLASTEYWSFTEFKGFS